MNISILQDIDFNNFSIIILSAKMTVYNEPLPAYILLFLSTYSSKILHFHLWCLWDPNVVI